MCHSSANQGPILFIFDIADTRTCPTIYLSANQPPVGTCIPFNSSKAELQGDADVAGRGF